MSSNSVASRLAKSSLHNFTNSSNERSYRATVIGRVKHANKCNLACAYPLVRCAPVCVCLSCRSAGGWQGDSLGSAHMGSDLLSTTRTKMLNDRIGNQPMRQLCPP